MIAVAAAAPTPNTCTCGAWGLPGQPHDPACPWQEPDDPDSGKLIRMNGRNQLDDAATTLAAAIQSYTQTYLDVVGALGLDDDPAVAQSLEQLTNAAEQAVGNIEKQLDRDLMQEQKEQQS